jgi:protein-tyrosine-phosphatase
MAMSAILFICTANICRSPMAAEIFRRAAEELNGPGVWKVDSAGTWAVNGLHASQNAQIVIGSMGWDISEHLSRDVSEINLHNYDLILTMEAGHKEALLTEYPEIKGRVYMLSEMVGSSFDVEDPIGGTIEDYKETVALLEDLIKRGYPKIKNLVRDPEE